MERIKDMHIYGITRKKSSMGNKRIIMFLLALFFFCSTASLFPQNKSLPNSVHLQEKNKGMDEYNSSSDGDTTSGTAHRSAVARTGGIRANGGQSGGRAENGNGGGGSRIPGGAAVIPIYGAAGAAGKHRNSHSAGTCYRSGLTTLSATILASLFMCI